MRQTVLFAIILSCSAFVAEAQEKLRVMESLSLHSAVLNQDVKYSICLPPDYYTSHKAYPVVYLLHGLGDNEFSWLEYGSVNQLADREIKNKMIIPMIFIIPQGFRSYYVNDEAKTFLYQDMFIHELVPFIDHTYRTIADKDHRATMGYSMGGYGALMLPVKNPDVFSVAVPLSISVRTDDQYKTEDASGWDEQWGRLFGGVGKTGEDRMTAYYQQNSPYYLFAQKDQSKLKDLKIYIDNGDDEGTLSKSNEELHMLLRDHHVPHEFRVRNGGHEFSYWREAMPNGVHFISDAFEGKVYRGDAKVAKYKPSKKPLNTRVTDSGTIVFPSDYDQTNRNYPSIYFVGIFSSGDISQIAGQIHDQTDNGGFPPMVLVFVKPEGRDLTEKIIPDVENNNRVRKGFRFRAIVGIGKGGALAMSKALVAEQFTACSVIDAPLDCELVKQTILTNGKKSLSRTWFFIQSPDKGPDYTSNGCIHVTLRESDVYHEYRVAEGDGGMAWSLAHLSEVLAFTEKKIHH